MVMCSLMDKSLEVRSSRSLILKPIPSQVLIDKVMSSNCLVSNLKSDRNHNRNHKVMVELKLKLKLIRNGIGRLVKSEMVMTWFRSEVSQ